MPRSLDQMIGDQIRRWETPAPPASHPPGPGPVITISREFGARGAALAAELGRRTGFRVWDREIVQAVAEHTGGAVELLATLDEHRRRMIEDAIGGLLLGAPHSNLPYLRGLLRILRTIAAHGDAIIVGRGANYVIAPEQALRVRVVCPLADRVAGFAERQGISPAEARRTIVRMDAERADFVRFHFRQDLTTATDYDLTLNAGTLSLAAMRDLVLAAYAARTGRRLAHAEATPAG